MRSSHTSLSFVAGSLVFRLTPCTVLPPMSLPASARVATCAHVMKLVEEPMVPESTKNDAVTPFGCRTCW